MRCLNCGTENNFDWATFCRNCNQPLRKENGGDAVQGSIDQNPANESAPTAQIQTARHESGDNAKIGVVDPMDFIMGSKGETQESLAMEITEQVSAEPDESEITLYKDDSMKLTVSEGRENQKLTVESIKDGYKVEATADDKVEITENYDDYETDRMNETVDQSNRPGQVVQSETPAETPESVAPAPEPPRVEASDAISIKPKIYIEPEIADETPGALPSLGEVKHSRGVIYLAGKTLKLTGGIKVEPGGSLDDQ